MMSKWHSSEEEAFTFDFSEKRADLPDSKPETILFVILTYLEFLKFGQNLSTLEKRADRKCEHQLSMKLAN